MSGTFIVLEGPDGSGTTTHSKVLAETLQAQGVDVLLTHEATDGPIGLFIREQLKLGTIDGTSLQMLFSADRAWHVSHVIQPALDAGKTVISDRYALSTIVYGEALGLDVKWLTDMNARFPKPDVTVIALPPFETCMARVNKRGSKDMLESQDSLQKRVYDSYGAHASAHGIPVLDTSGSKEEVSSKLMALITK